LFDATDAIIGMLPLWTGFMNTVEFRRREDESGGCNLASETPGLLPHIWSNGELASRLAHEAVGKAVALAGRARMRFGKNFPLADLQADFMRA